ncbi:uncharacterized protein LOC144422093 [Styela clava]
MDSNEDSPCAEESSHQEPLLNISASQLVQIMTCAMKRKDNDQCTSIQSKKQCTSSVQKLAVDEHKSSTKSRQELIERNQYLERRVKQLEALNYNLQCGLLNAVRETISESLEAQLRMNDIALRRRNSSPQGNQQLNSLSSNQQSWQPLPIQGESIVNDVTSTTSRTPELCSDILSSEESHSPQSSHFYNVASTIKSEKIFDESGVLQSLQNGQFEASTSVQSEYISSPEVVTDNNCQDQSLVPNAANCRLIGMAHEIQMIVQESTNYKKLTNKLLNVLFDREELASSTLTGKSKGDQEKEKLDEDTVNLIVQQAIMRFPGTSPTDIRMVISQNCKDKAIRLQRKVQREALQQQLALQSRAYHVGHP